MKINQMVKISMFTLLIAVFSTGSMHSMRRFAPKVDKAMKIPVIA